MTKTCACGRPLRAGWTAGAGADNTRCLICTTRTIMRDFRDPMTVKYQARKKAKV